MPRQSLQVDAGVVVGLKEQAATLVQGSNALAGRGRDGSFSGLNRPPDWKGAFGMSEACHM